MDRVFSMLYPVQTYIVNEEELTSGLNLSNQYQIVSLDNTKPDCVQEGFLQQPQQCIAEPMDVTEALGEPQQVAIVSAGPILPVAVTPQGQPVILHNDTQYTSVVPISSPVTITKFNITTPQVQTLTNSIVVESNGRQQSKYSTELVSTSLPTTPVKKNGDICSKDSSTSPDKFPDVITIPGDVQNSGNPSITQLVLVAPDGIERTVTINQPLETLDLKTVLIQVCRQEGFDDTMEAVVHYNNPSIAGVLNTSSDAVHIQLSSKDSPIEKSAKKLGEQPLYVSGKLAVCQQCGYLSQDFNKCQRCRRKLPANCRSVPVSPILEKHEVKKDKRRCVRRTKKPEEPVCLTISSDEEDNNSPKKSAPEEQTVTKVIKNTLNDKEPIITESTEPPEDNSSMTLGVAGGGMDITELIDAPETENALLQCRTVRIGSYKVVPIDKVLLSKYGLKIQVPSMKGDPTTIKILRHEIVKVLVHFGRTLPVMFYYVTAAAGGKIRTALQMPNKEISTYFDPTSSEEMHKRITLLPEKITEETRLFIKSIYEVKSILGELTSSEANDILVRAAPKEIQLCIKKESIQTPSCHPIQTIMVYPPPPAKGGISINTEDYACLGEDQFLNDVIIDFYLKYLLQTMLSPEDQKRTHVFSSFFYKRLTTRATPQAGLGAKYVEDPKLSPAEKRHHRVKGWTKSVDLFSKDFIIIPINENSHWFLGIICFPGLTSPVRMSDSTVIQIPEKKKANDKAKNDKVDGTVLTGGVTPATIGNTTITKVQPPVGTITLEPDEEDRDEAEGDDEDLEPNTSEDEASKDGSEGELLDEATPKVTRPPKPPTEPIKQPCILIFDSLAGASRSRVCATLRDYLRVEYKVRHKSSTRDFSKDVLKGACPKVPQQTNFTDCGLYVLQYVESFFQKPVTNYRMPIKMLKDWFTPEIVSRKRYQIQQLLHKLMEEQNIDVARLNLPFLGLKDGNSRMEYSENEEEEEMEHEEDEEEGLEEEEDGELGLVEEEEEEDEEEIELETGAVTTITNHISSPEPTQSHQPLLTNHTVSSPSKPTQIVYCENNSIKRKSSLTLKDIRNPRLLRHSPLIDNCKKIRTSDD